MQGELELRKLDYKGALSHYLKAAAADSTPLAAMGLAETLLQAGYPDEAKQYIASAKSKTDLAWIANYGTTTDQYKVDLYKLEKDFYRHKRNLEKRILAHNFSTGVKRTWAILHYTFDSWYYDAVYRIQNKTVARYYEKSERKYNKITNQGLYINSFYFLAFNRWQKIANSYLSRAESIEFGQIPAAGPSYLYERGLLEKDISLLNKALETLNPVWERQYISKALSERLLLIKNPKKGLYQEDACRLFSLNPSAFIFYNIKLPISISLSSINLENSKKLKALLLQSGFAEVGSSPLSVSISEKSDTISLILYDKNRKTTIYTQVFHCPPAYSQGLYDIVNNFSSTIFKSELNL
jgi:hypothetical protein